jgi:alpha-N-arabinofuranosidase
MAVHWYVGNREDDFAQYMTLSEVFEDRLSAYEGLIRALRLANRLTNPIGIAVDEWNVWYRAIAAPRQHDQLEEIYNLEDALVVAMHLNAFIRHAASVKMANIAQIVNVIAPVFTAPEGLFLQTTFYPFELYSQQCGATALDVWWEGETFAAGDYSGVRTLDVAATLDADQKRVTIFAVNRSETQAQEATISLDGGQFAGSGQISVINGATVKTANSFQTPEAVATRTATLAAEGCTLTLSLEPHSVTALAIGVR